MRNGGVAILGNAEAAGDNRAQKAIEEALNSPLLNDSEIRGAKWILININSSEGEYEFTMDEVEVIQNYLLSHAGENTDVILGMGYDSTLGNKIGITLIATGFEHKDPFAKPVPKKEEPIPEEKIVMVLGRAEERKEETVPVVQMEMVKEERKEDLLAPKLVDEMPVIETPVYDITDMKEESTTVIHWELQPEEKLLSNTTEVTAGESTVGKMSTAVKNETIHSILQLQSVSPTNKKEDAELSRSIKDSTSTAPVSAASGGYLARPSNIYAESKTEVYTSITSAEEPVPSPHAASNEEEELLELQMQIIERDNIPATDTPLAHHTLPQLQPEVEDSALQDETTEQQRRAAERLHKLRNLSFNVNAADPNNEFETVPAYIRRNMEFYNNNAKIENFYSSYEVKADQNNQGQISTINTFLDGKKPD
jgi:cell division protein FtsZ